MRKMAIDTGGTDSQQIGVREKVLEQAVRSRYHCHQEAEWTQCGS
jgi:hypothetical protein